MKAILVLFSMVVWTSAVFAQPDPDDWAEDIYYNTYNTSKMAMADLSGDGKVDLISAEQAGPYSFYITYRPNNGSGLFSSSAVLRSYSVSYTGYVFKDMDTINVDGNGVMELAVSYSKDVSSVVTYHVDILQVSGSTLVLLQTINVPAGGAQLVKSGYFDGVDYPTTRLGDLAVGSGSAVYIYKNNGTSNPYFGGSGGTPNFTIQGSGMSTIRALNVGEFYNSGYGNDQNAGFNEIVLLEMQSQSDQTYRGRRWKNNTPAAGANWFVQESADPMVNTITYGQPYNYLTVNAADFNGDGSQDFLFNPGIRAGASGTTLSWPAPRYYFVDGTFPTYVTSSVPADINNDGKLDVIANSQQTIDYTSDYPFVCYNDGSNGFPDDVADIEFQPFLIPGVSEHRTAQGMTLLAGDITGLGAVSIVCVAAEDAYPWKDNKVVVYRRLDNPAPAPPVLVYVGKNTPTSNLIRVFWKANPELDVTGYEVWRGFSASPSVPPTTWSLKAAVGGTSWIEDDFIIGGSWAHNYAHYRIKAQDSQNQLSAVSNSMAVAVGAMLPKTAGEEGHRHQFLLAQNSPNPFNPTTRISYEIPEAGHVTLKIFNAVGQHVATLVNDYQEAGAKEITWNGKDDSGNEVASGLYLYRLQAGDQIKTMKMNLLK